MSCYAGRPSDSSFHAPIPHFRDLGFCPRKCDEAESHELPHGTNNRGKPSCSMQLGQWLLQAAEIIFKPSAIPPDVLTEEPEGSRRPLILASLSWAIELEARLLQDKLYASHSSPDPAGEQKDINKQGFVTAFDLVRLLLARGASLNMPSEAGVLPLEYAVKKRSTWVPHHTTVCGWSFKPTVYQGIRMPSLHNDMACGC